jgi:hypothetical protein
MGFTVTSERLAHFHSLFGAGRFFDVREDWALIGLNSEILSSGLPEEKEQWDWLAEVGQRAAGHPAIVFLHKPLWSPLPQYTEHALAIEEPDRDRLFECLRPVDVRLVANGHLHQYQHRVTNGIQTVSAPSSAFVTDDHDLEFGLSQCGLVEYRIEGDRVDAYFRAIPSLEELAMTAIPEAVSLLDELTAASAL